MNSSRLYTCLVLFFLAATDLVQAQTCVPQLFPTVTDNHTPNGFTLVWTPPAGAGPNTRYEIVRDVANSWCPIETGTAAREVIASGITGTSFNVSFGPPGTIQCYWARVTDCPQIRSNFCYLADTLSTPASVPNLISAQPSGPGKVTLTYSHPNENTAGVVAFRAPAGGQFTFVDFVNICPVGATHTYTDEGLAAGTYTYLLSAYTILGGPKDSQQRAVTVTTTCVPPQSIQLTTPSQNVVARGPVTLNWTVDGAVNYFLVEIGSDQAMTEILHSFRLPANLRTGTATFPLPGAFHVRMTAVNECGSKQSNVVRFNVAPAPARVGLTAKPSGMLQVLGEGKPSTDSYTLTNFGGTPTTIQLQRNGNFFNHAPTQFTLQPGASQIITITANAQADGQYEGSSTPTGNGVPTALSIPVRLLAATRPSADPLAKPEVHRMDMAGPAGANPSASVTFRNEGPGTVKGILLSDVPWIVTEDSFVNFGAGGSASLRFRLDRSQRSQSIGSLKGRLMLVYLPGPPGPSGKISSVARRIFGATPPPGSKVSVITITDTVQPELTSGPIPAIAAGELAWFVPGVVHASGGGATLKSDVALVNTSSVASLESLRFYLGAGANAQSMNVNGLSADQTLKLSDVTKAVFNVEDQITTLQVRAASSDSLAIDAELFAEVPNLGSYGTKVPIFRSDRGVGASQTVYLTGMKKDASYDSEIFIQEVSGQSANLSVALYNANGFQMGAARAASVESFGLTRVADLPSGVASAIVTNNSGSAGRIQAYALMSDVRTSDTWASSDWSNYYGYAANQPVYIPVTGKARGLRGLDFRSDLTIMNIGNSNGAGTLTYYPDFGPSVDRALTLGARESRTLTNVLESLFGINRASAVGYLVFTPTTGSFVTTGRVYTTGPGGVTYNSAVPSIGSSFILVPGEVRKISGIEDTTVVTASSGRPGTYRSNFGILETSGEPVTVRATLRYTAVQGSASSVGVSSAEFTLAPRQFLMMSSITAAILRERRYEFGDLHDIQVDFEVVSETGRAMVFVTTTENGTNDTAVRVE